MFVRSVILGLAIMAFAGSALAQSAGSASAQRAFIIANMAQQLGQAEIQDDALQSALAKAQKESQDWQDAFHAWCGSAPNCGRPGPEKQSEPHAMSVPTKPGAPKIMPHAAIGVAPEGIDRPKPCISGTPGPDGGAVEVPCK